MFGFELPGVIKSGLNFASKFVEDKTEKLKASSQERQLQITLGHEMNKLAIKSADSGNMAVYNDLAQSRAMHSKEMEKAPWLIRLLNGLVRPLGGLGALITLFWVVWAPYFGYPAVVIPDFTWDNPFWVLVESIIAFYFVLRHKAKVQGVSTKP